MNKLKPCPFCDKKRPQLCQDVDDGFYVNCSKCKIQTKTYKTKEKCIKKWNTRKGDK